MCVSLCVYLYLHTVYEELKKFWTLKLGFVPFSLDFLGMLFNFSAP